MPRGQVPAQESRSGVLFSRAPGLAAARRGVALPVLVAARVAASLNAPTRQVIGRRP
jgi:hypothetical protein